MTNLNSGLISPFVETLAVYSVLLSRFCKLTVILVPEITALSAFVHCFSVAFLYSISGLPPALNTAFIFAL